MYFGHKKFTFGKPDKQIKDVMQHENATGIGIIKKSDLKDIIDEPCLRACEELFDKNIRTIDSGCSQECPNYAYIVIAYDSLDWKNKMLAQKMIADKKAKFEDVTKDNYIRTPERTLEIGFQTSPDDLVFDVSKKLCSMIAKFKKQEKVIEFSPFKRWNAQYEDKGILPDVGMMPTKELKDLYNQWVQTIKR